MSKPIFFVTYLTFDVSILRLNDPSIKTRYANRAKCFFVVASRTTILQKKKTRIVAFVSTYALSILIDKKNFITIKKNYFLNLITYYMTYIYILYECIYEDKKRKFATRIPSFLFIILFRKRGEKLFRKLNFSQNYRGIFSLYLRSVRGEKQV